jgi:uncharacterized membrane protein YkvA (DUF1232 family)
VRTYLKLGVSVLSLWPFVPITARVPLYGRLLLKLLADARVPASRKALLGIAAAYVVAPFDLIPDFIPFISRFDDAAVVVVALDLFLESVPRDVLLDRMYALGIDGRELERDLESVRRFVPKPIRSALMRLPQAIDSGVSIVRRRLDMDRPAVRPRRNASE